MTIDATPTVLGPQRPALRVLRASDGIRDDAERVVIATAEALEPWLECIAIADDAIATAQRIALAAAAGSRQAIVNEANRLAFRASACRSEARDRIAGIEPKRVA